MLDLGHPVSELQLARVQLGMSKSEVTALLGEPTTVTLYPGDQIWNYRQPFIWCIVQIRFDSAGKVTEIDHDH